VLDIPGTRPGTLAYYGSNMVFWWRHAVRLRDVARIRGTPQQLTRRSKSLLRSPMTRSCIAARVHSGEHQLAKTVEPSNSPLLEREAIDARLRATTSRRSLDDTRGKATNPFLRVMRPAVIDPQTSTWATRQRSCRVFAALRQWRTNSDRADTNRASRVNRASRQPIFLVKKSF